MIQLEPLAQVCALLGTALAVQLIFQQPATPIESETVAGEGLEKFFKPIALRFPQTVSVSAWITALSESALLLANEYSDHPLSRHILELFTGSHLPLPSPLMRLSPTVLVGLALVAGGTVFRRAAFRAMGRHFTYRITMKKDHQLITEYPYSIVRHPGYTGLAVGALGANLVLFGPSNRFVWDVVLPRLRAIGQGSGSLSVGLVGIVAVGIAQASIVFDVACAVVCARVGQEDKLLRERFGQEWRDWARRVPYKLFPGVY